MPRPPSTIRVSPVMNDASELARKAIDLATSSTVPGLVVERIRSFRISENGG